MSKINWRMPQPGQRPAAVLRDGLTVADVAEALGQPEHLQIRKQEAELIMQVVAPTVSAFLLQIVLYRNDDSFVWWVWGARIARFDEAKQWEQRGA